MKLCPHCGAELHENARFCPCCMASLIEKRVIPKARYISLRWLPIASAVLALVVAVELFPRTASLPVNPDSNGGSSIPASVSTSASASPYEPSSDGDGTPTGTAGTDLFSSTSGNTESRRPGNTYIYRPDAAESTTATAERYGSDVSETTTQHIVTTSLTQPKTTTTTKATTTTTKKTTTTTTHPYWYDATPSSFTEDGLPIEEITWYYRLCTGEKLSYSTEIFGESYSFSQTTSGVPISQCIIVTGFDRPTSNGIYRVPAVIDGKVVVEVDMRYDTPQQRHFNDSDIAPTVRRIYYPPDLLAVRNNTMNLCTSLERIYFTGERFWLQPNGIPLVNDIVENDPIKRNLTIYCDLECSPFYISSYYLYEYRPYPITYICYRISNSPSPKYPAFHKYLSESNIQLIYGEGSV